MKSIKVNTNVYSLRSIFSAVYIFLDKAYIFLDSKNPNEVEIQVKTKNNADDIDKLIDEIKNELASASLRLAISEENKEIREMIVCAALYGPKNSPSPKTGGSKKSSSPKIDDPQNISKTWEEMHGCDCKEIEIQDTKEISKTREEANVSQRNNRHMAVNKGCCPTSNQYSQLLKENQDDNSTK